MIEMTINKSIKAVGCLQGVMENKGASEKRVQIVHFLAALKQYLGVPIQRGQLSQHTEFSIIRIEKDQDHVK